MLPLLREAPAARIVNVSSGVGSLTRNSDPAYAYRSIFGPVYPASKTALNAMTLAMAIELESTGIKVNAASPGFTKTNLNNYAGTRDCRGGRPRAGAPRAARPGRSDGHVLERRTARSRGDVVELRTSESIQGIALEYNDNVRGLSEARFQEESVHGRGAPARFR